MRWLRANSWARTVGERSLTGRLISRVHTEMPSHMLRAVTLKDQLCILLLHDIHPATAMALPTLLKELKARGFHVVQVVAAGDRPKFVPELLASPATQKDAWPTVLKMRQF